MTSVAEFRLPASELALGVVFERFPDATLTMDRLVPAGDGIVTYVWTKGVGKDDLSAVLDTIPTIESAHFVDSIDGRWLVRIHWQPTDENESVLAAVVDSDATLLSATGSVDGWVFEVRGPDRAAIAAFGDACTRAGLSIEVVSIQPYTGGSSGSAYDLTPAQNEALLAAYRAGYFAEQRQATLEDIAADIGITRQALAARLRRAHRTLIAATIANE